MASILQTFTNVRREELSRTLVAGLFFFFVLSALMVVRPAREALGMQRGIDAIRWLFFGTLLVTLLVNPIFGWLVSRFKRQVFISSTYVFFAVGLVGFYVLLVFSPTHVGQISGQVFYVWFSVFNLFATMLFWALMTDSFTKDQSERLFGAISLGGTLGAMFGPWLASQLAKPYGTATLLLVAAGFLVLATLCAWWMSTLCRSFPLGDKEVDSEASTKQEVEHPIGGNAWAGFGAVLRSPFSSSSCARRRAGVG